MKRYEKVALALGVPGSALGFYVSGCSLATETLLPLALAALALMMATIAVVKLGRKEDQEMTYREMLQRDHPRKCDSRFIGGCQGCPGDYYPDAPTEDENGCFYNGTDDEYQCEKCWDRTDAKKDPTE